MIGLAGLACVTTAVPTANAAPSGRSGKSPGLTFRLAWRANLPYGNILSSAAAPSPNQIWAVGLGLKEPQASYVLHWNGHRWQRSAPPARGFTPEEVRASSPENVWLLGWRKFKPVAYIWNGQDWHSISLPANTFTATVLLGPADAWLVGQATKIDKHVVTPLWRWNGNSWQSYQMPALIDSGHGLTGTSDTNLWIAGIQTGTLNVAKPGWLTAYRWTGSAWKKASLPRRRVLDGSAVTASAAGDVWIQGNAAKVSHGFHLSTVLHYFKGRWTQLPVGKLFDPAVLPLWPTAVGHNVWFHLFDYWNGHRLRFVSVRPRNQCEGILDGGLSVIPGTSITLMTAGCPPKTGHTQGILYISKP
jgi:hypothetical protein